MYLHIGDKGCIREKEIVGIFDLEVTTTMKTTAEFLNISQEEGFTVNAVDRGEMPKSFILADKQGVSRVYISPVSTATLNKRYLNNKRKRIIR
ncbi:MAG: DUF370 domain-containing protein [Clostridia bacterium]|nr:DUF370 domain-containing protein [Clostridia bacterium]